MDKHIIIDGVDVSGCGYIDHDSAWCDLCMTNCAKETNPCYYKKWQRAEQKLAEKDKEIERLKQGIKHYQRGMFSIINTATECRNNKKWNYKE